MSVRTNINSIKGFIAGVLLWGFGKKAVKPTCEDLKQAEFKTSTQKLGIRFTEKIRNIFRYRWIKKT